MFIFPLAVIVDYLRRYRGHDFAWWGGPLGSWEQSVDTLPSPQAKNDPGPLLTPANGGHDVDLRRMAADGVTLLGRVQGIAGSILIIADDLQKNLADGDLRFTDYKKLVDEYVSKAGLTCPEETSSRQEWPNPMKFCVRYGKSI